MFHPHYTCRRVNHNLDITGRLTDPAWEEAEVAEFTDLITGNPIPFRATGRLLYNNEFLYIGFSCDDDFVLATYTERDKPVWEEGCFEAFICPSGKIRNYYEINVSPLNTIFDAFILNATEKTEHPVRRMESFVQYTCHNLVTKTWVNGGIGVQDGAKGWSAEYAIPFISIPGADNLAPVSGDEWRLNLCHIASPKGDETPVHSCWATMGCFDFHLPWQFGTLKFA